MVSDWKKPMDKALARAAGHRSNHEAWADFAVLFASELMAPLYENGPLVADAERIRDKYDDGELEAMAEMMGCTVGALEENPRQDFLGSAYMVLGIGNGKHGQVFTPYAVCEAMADAQMVGESVAKAMDEKGYVTLNDPACGGGATLIAGANSLRAQGFDYQNFAWFVGQDINLETACMCYVQLALLGCAGAVIIGDTLACEQRMVLRLPMNVISPWWTARILQGKVSA